MWACPGNIIQSLAILPTTLNSIKHSCDFITSTQTPINMNSAVVLAFFAVVAVASAGVVGPAVYSAYHAPLVHAPLIRAAPVVHAPLVAHAPVLRAAPVAVAHPVAYGGLAHPVAYGGLAAPAIIG